MAFKQQPLNQADYAMKIIKDLGCISTTPTSDRKARFAIFECSKCKTHFKVRCGSTKAKQQTACLACTVTKHNSYKEPLYTIWNTIKQRCYSPTRKDYHKYGAKGVTMAEEWKDSPEHFITWCKANGWQQGLVIDKDIKSRELGITPPIYSPETVSFITAQENAEEANAKSVLQYSKDGEFIAEYPSTVKAALALGKSMQAKSSIANCCRGISKSSFGYLWKYKEF